MVLSTCGRNENVHPLTGWSTPNLANGLISWKPWNGPWDQVRGGLELVGAVPGSRFGVGRARVCWILGGELGVTPLKTRVGSVLRRLYSQIGFARDQKVSRGFLLAIGRGFGPKIKGIFSPKDFFGPPGGPGTTRLTVRRPAT